MVNCAQLMNGMAAARMQEGVTNYPENSAFVCARGTKRRAALWWRCPLICALGEGCSVLLGRLGDASGFEYWQQRIEHCQQHIFDAFLFIDAFRNAISNDLPLVLRKGDIDCNVSRETLWRDNSFNNCLLRTGDGAAFLTEPVIYRTLANVQLFGQLGTRGAALDEPLL